jgi:putative ABC transport system permease protein
VVISFLLLGLLDAVTVAFESGADSADAKRLLTTARYSIIEPLPLSYLRRIEQVPGVTGVAHADWFGAKYQNESNAFPVFAVDPRRYLAMYPEFDIAPAHLEAFAATRTGAVAGQRLVDRFGWRVGQKLPISSEIHARADGDLNWEFDLVGIIDAEDPAVRGNTDVVLINVAYFDEARLTGKGKTGWYIERVADPAGARAIAAEIDRRFANSPDETKTQPEKEFAIGFAKQIGDVGALVARILAAVFFTLLLLTGNAMAQSIRERIPELAILKTLGFSDGKVTALVLAEALLLMGLGAGLGMAAAAGPLAVRQRVDRGPVSSALHQRAHLGRRGGARRRGRLRHRASARRPRAPAPDRGRPRGASLMAWLNQVIQITLVNLRSLPQRLGTSLVVVIGIAGVVGVLVSVLAMAEGFRHTLTSAGRPSRVVMLRAGSDSELSSGVVRDQATLLASIPGLARDAEGRPLASPELMVMVDLPRKGESHPNNVPFRGVGSRRLCRPR